MYYNIYSETNIRFLLYLVEECRYVKQELNYHPEGDVYNHSLQVLFIAFRESRDIDLILAGLLHDVGKIIDSKGHENYGVEILEGYVSDKTIWLVENHMRIKYFLSGELKKRKKVLMLFNNDWFKDLILLNRWDNMGRKPNFNSSCDKNKILDRLMEVTS